MSNDDNSPKIDAEIDTAVQTQTVAEAKPQFETESQPPAPKSPPAKPTAVLEICNLSHRFKKHLALNDVSFAVARQTIHGFVGPNGAGKTTALKIVATLLKSQRGQVRVFDHHVKTHKTQIRMKIGFMPDHFSMYRQMTLYEYLDFFAAAYGLKAVKRKTTLRDVLALTDMAGRQDDLLQGFSKGMLQRSSLARVLINDPQLLLLDEPAAGLDPRARIELMDILRELKNMGKTIFISSHILSELAMICDDVTILDQGQVKYTGPVAGLLATDGQQTRYLLDLSELSSQTQQTIADLPGVQKVEQMTLDNVQPASYRIHFDCEQVNTNTLLRAALSDGVSVTSFKKDEKHLNQAFMDLTSPGVRSSSGEDETGNQTPGQIQAPAPDAPPLGALPEASHPGVLPGVLPGALPGAPPKTSHQDAKP